MLIILAGFTLHIHAQNKFYVKTNGYGSGKSWSLASNDLQKIVDAASAGDSVFVAIGTYKGGFVMKDGVIVKGGYTGYTTNPGERIDVKTATSSQQSILDGEGKQRVITQYSKFDIPTIWDGFVIQNGKPSPQFQAGSIIYSVSGENKIVGILYKYDTESGKGMMIGTEEIKKQWGGYLSDISDLQINKNANEARQNISGIENSNKILTEMKDLCVDFSREDYGSNGNYAAYWCDTLQTGGYTDWYLPSAGELQEVFDSNVNKTLKNIGKELQNGYWSSSHIGNSLAWAYYFECAHLHPAIKYRTHSVRAVCPYENSQQGGILSAGGGALLNQNGILKNCIITNNESTSFGGGVYAGIGSKLQDCIVEGNTAPVENEIYYENGSDIQSVILNENAVKIYPNPVKKGEAFTISIEQDNLRNEQISFRILDTSGKTVKAKRSSETILNPIAPDQAGMYFLQLHSFEKNITLKLMVY